MKRMNISIVGCGFISDIYIQNLNSLFQNTRVHALCDIIRERAESQAKKYGIPRVCSFNEILQDSETDIVLILTTPESHYELCRLSLEAGKHTYVEKPLSLNYEQGLELCELAKARGVRLGCAPDTFLGAALQTSRKAIDDGLIGDVVAASAFLPAGDMSAGTRILSFIIKKAQGRFLIWDPTTLPRWYHCLAVWMRYAEWSRKLLSSEPLQASRNSAGQLMWKSEPICRVRFGFVPGQSAQ